MDAGAARCQHPGAAPVSAARPDTWVPVRPDEPDIAPAVAAAAGGAAPPNFNFPLHQRCRLGHRIPQPGASTVPYVSMPGHTPSPDTHPDAMPIALLPLSLPHLRVPEAALREPAAQASELPAPAGAQPPRFVLDEAMVAADEGRPPVWALPFVFVESRRRQIVGAGGFRGLPDPRRIEIGFGIAADFRGRGHATDAVRSLLALAFSQPGVAEVRAETAIGNAASRRVLEKTGFRHVGRRMMPSEGVVDLWACARG